MLIHHLKVSGLLSFGPSGIDLPMEPLNVLIGPNGSGKSNLLEVLSLLRTAPTNLPRPIKEMGGVQEWFWKGPNSARAATLDIVVAGRPGKPNIRHILEIGENGERFEVFDETIEDELPNPGHTTPFFHYKFNRGLPRIQNSSLKERKLRRESFKPEESVLSQVRDPESYPVLHWLEEQYERIRLYRNWTFGPLASTRKSQSAHGQSDNLSEGGENLPIVLSNIRAKVKQSLIESLRNLIDGIEDVGFSIDGGNVQLFLEEGSGRSIPASRLSDGTLRYLSLLTVLLHPEPPPLVAIEEPELGLHPDVIPHIAELLVSASQRMQLVVTTHSRRLIDALSDHPSSVVVCERGENESQFQRLDAKELSIWLENYSLGDLWSRGKLGGNRW